ncbi:hypothetical protein [Streptomyces sp. NPDC008001]|uniref:hypothetical protein n=1 Tax=Streptomyces sp. NPDC008001 TaxID=3364804 RepID=UPI0036E3E5AA
MEKGDAVKPGSRLMTMLVATALFCLGGAALAAPAQADDDIGILGNVAHAHADGTVETSVLGVSLPTLPNPLTGLT